MQHTYGLKLPSTCFSSQRRFNPMEVCTAYVSYENTTESTGRTQQTQYYILGPSPTSAFNSKTIGYAYNIFYQPSTVFNNYYFDKDDVDLWNFRGSGCFMGICAFEYLGPTYSNNCTIIPLAKHPTTPATGLKQGRLDYNWLNADPVNIGSSLIDPLHFTGVYPFILPDTETLHAPAGWMYSNTNVPEPYRASRYYEDGGGTIDRSSVSTTQLNFLPFADTLRVYDLNSTLIGGFDGLAFIVYFGEMHFALPFDDEQRGYEGLIPDPLSEADPPDRMNPTFQLIGLEIDIYLAGTTTAVKSPRIGRLRFWCPNRSAIADPTLNYFNFLFSYARSTSYVMPMLFNILPAQATAPQTRYLPISNLKVNIGA